MSEEPEEYGVEVSGQQEQGAIMLRESAARAEMMGKLIPTLVKACHQRNILDMGGNPYIDNDGCQKIARTVGISFGKPDVESYWDEDEGVKVWVVEVCGEATVMGQTIYEVGGCTSQDKFLSSRRMGMMQLKIEVKKKAIANWQGRCVRTLLGMKELTWAELEAQGFSADAAGKVEYKTGRDSNSKTNQKKDTEAEENLKEVKVKIGNQLIADCGNDKNLAAKLLESLTAFEGKDGDMVKGKTSVTRLSEKQAFYFWGSYRPNGTRRDIYEEHLAKIHAENKSAGEPEDDVPFE